MAIAIDWKAQELGTVRVDLGVIECWQCFYKVAKVLSAVVVNAKVTNYQAEGNLSGVMTENSRGRGFYVTVLLVVCGKAVFT